MTIEWKPERRTAIPEENDPTWGDWGRYLGVAGAGIAEGAASTREYVSRSLGDTEGAEQARRYRHNFRDTREDITEGMTYGGRRALEAEFLPEPGGDKASVWERPVASLSAKAVAAVPSVLVSMVPAGMFARAGVFAGRMAGAATAGGLSAGQVTNDIMQQVETLPEDVLQRENPYYRELRSMEYTDREARDQLTDRLIGYKPLIAAAVSAATVGAFGGIEGAVAGRVAGQGARGGFARHVGSAMGTEALQEGTEQAAQSLLTQGASLEGGWQKNLDWRKFWNDVVEGSTVGGLMGGAVGAGTYQRPRGPNAVDVLTSSPVAPDHQQALTPAPTTAAPIEQVSPSTVDPDQQQALASAPPAAAPRPPTTARPVEPAQPVEQETPLPGIPAPRPPMTPKKAGSQGDLFPPNGPRQPDWYDTLDAWQARPREAGPQPQLSSAPDPAQGSLQLEPPAAPVATEPVATEPVATEPVATEPVATEPKAPAQTPALTGVVREDVAATQKAAKEQAEFIAKREQQLKHGNRAPIGQRDFALKAERQAFYRKVEAELATPSPAPWATAAKALIEATPSGNSRTRSVMTKKLRALWEIAVAAQAVNPTPPVKKAVVAKTPRAKPPTQKVIRPKPTPVAAESLRSILERHPVSGPREGLTLQGRQELRERVQRLLADVGKIEALKDHPLVERMFTLLSKPEVTVAAAREYLGAELLARDETLEKLDRAERTGDIKSRIMTSKSKTKADGEERTIEDEVDEGLSDKEVEAKTKAEAAEEALVDADARVAAADEDLDTPTIKPRDRPAPPVEPGAVTGYGNAKPPAVVVKKGTRTPLRPKPPIPALSKGRGLEVADGALRESEGPLTVRTALNEVMSPEALEDLYNTSTTTVRNVVNRMLPFVGDIEVLTVSGAQLAKTTGDPTHAEAYGMYVPSTHKIYLRDDLSESLRLRVLLHEMVHPFTIAAMQRDRALARDIALLAQAARKAAGGTPFAEQYGFTDTYEFLAEAITSPEFQEFLQYTTAPGWLTRSIKDKYPSKGNLIRTLWDRLRYLLRVKLSLPVGADSFFDSVMRVMPRFEEHAAEHGTWSAELLDTWDHDRAQFMRGTVTPRSVTDGINTLNASWQAAMAGTGYRLSALQLRWLKFSAAGMTLGQMPQTFKGMFQSQMGDHLERLRQLQRKMQPWADNVRDAGEKHAQTLMELQRTDPVEYRKLAGLAIDVTMANVLVVDGHPTIKDLLKLNKHLGKDRMSTRQARKELMPLQSRFMELKPATRRQFMAMAGYFREQQAAITNKLASNLLDAVIATPLTDAQRATLQTKTVAGTLDDADAALINDPTVFEALKGFKALRVIDGTYFPLMRHGNYVVLTGTRVASTQGGKLIAPDTIEFRGTDLKTVKAKADKFQDTSGERVQGVETKWYDPLTGAEILKDNAIRLPAYEVAIELRVATKGLEMFDTPTEAARWRAENAGDFDTVSEVLPADQIRGHSDFMPSQLKALEAAIDRRDDVSDGNKELMKAVVLQAAITQMSGNRAQKRSLVRRNVQGASHDLARNTLVYAEASSRYRAKLEFMPGINAEIAAMSEIVKTAGEQGKQARTVVLQELVKRLNDNVINPSEPGRFVRWIMAWSFMDKLFSAGYSVINAMQVPLMLVPYLGARYGNGATVAAVQKAYSAIGVVTALSGGVTNTVTAMKGFTKTMLDTRDVHGSIRKKLNLEKDGEALDALVQYALENGVLNADVGFELAAAAASKSGSITARMDRIARQAPLVVEQVNRYVSLVSAYRLEVAKGTAHEAAMEAAVLATENTQFDYSAASAPRLFNKPLLRPALQFKKYAQATTWLLLEATRVAMKGATPEERKIARKHIANVLATQIVFAGAMGLPGLEIAKIAAMTAGVLGFGAGWEDIEEELRRRLEGVVGKTAGELLAKGLPRAIGLDISSRVSMADMWTFGEPKGDPDTGVPAYAMGLIGGAPLSMMFEWRKAAEKAFEGDFLGAVRYGVPVKFIADSAGAIINARKEDNFGLKEWALNPVGLRTAAQAEEGRDRGVKRRAREAQQKLHKKYLQEFFGARRAPRAEQVRVIARNREWNKTAPLSMKLPTQFR